MAIQNAKDIYDMLKEIGLTRAQVRKILPDWWSPEAEKHPDGIVELCLLVSRRLSLDLTALLAGEIKQKGAVVSVAYKHRADAVPQALLASTCIASSLAQAVVSAMPQPYTLIPPNPVEFATLAQKAGSGVIGLASLIEACWSMGIPVIPLPNLPVGVRKMDGAVLKIGNRPAIIISKKKSSRAWLAFILAHEIGHIACGHLEKNASIVDVSLQEQATYEVESSTDIQEREADEFALALFGGADVNSEVASWPTWVSPVELAVKAREAGKSWGVESGHLVLRYAFATKRWADASMALRYLSEDANAEAIMKASLKENLDLDLVSDDLRDLVCQITGIDAA